MIKPSDNVVRALKNLESNVNWQEIVTWMRESLFSQSLRNNALTGEEAHKGQGRGLELEEILKHVKNVHNYGEKKQA